MSQCLKALVELNDGTVQLKERANSNENCPLTSVCTFYAHTHTPQSQIQSNNKCFLNKVCLAPASVTVTSPVLR